MVKYPYWQHLRALVSLNAPYQVPLGLPPPCPRVQDSHFSPAQPEVIVISMEVPHDLGYPSLVCSLKKKVPDCNI